MSRKGGGGGGALVSWSKVETDGLIFKKRTFELSFLFYLSLFS